MRHLNYVTKPEKAETKGTDTEDILLGGIIFCLISGDCDLGDIKTVFNILDIFS